MHAVERFLPGFLRDSYSFLSFSSGLPSFLLFLLNKCAVHICLFWLNDVLSKKCYAYLGRVLFLFSRSPSSSSYPEALRATAPLTLTTHPDRA